MITAVVLLVLALFSPVNFLIQPVSAQIVSIGNAPPQFTKPPLKSEAVVPTDPERAIVTITAVGEDGNSDPYALHICATDAISMTETGTVGCGDRTLCISETVPSGSPASCSFSTHRRRMEPRVTAFLCDTHATDPRCSVPLVDDPDNAVQFSTGPSVLGVQTTTGHVPDHSFKFPSLTIQNGKAVAGFTFSFLALLGYWLIIGRRRALARPGYHGITTSIYGIFSMGLLFLVLTTSPGSLTLGPNPQTVLGMRDHSTSVSADPDSVKPVLRRPSIAGLYEIFALPSETSPVIYYATEKETFPTRSRQTGWIEILLPTEEYGWIPETNVTGGQQ